MSGSLRRFPTAVLALVLTGGGLLIAAPPSHAAALGLAQLEAEVSFDKNEAAGHTCTQTGPGNADSGLATFAADGVPVTRSVSSSAVLTDNAVAADQTTMAAGATVTGTATQVGGQLTNVHIAGSGSASLTTAVANTSCGASLDAGGVLEFQFSLAAPTLLTISAEAHHMIGIVEAGSLLGSSDDPEAALTYTLGGHGVSTTSVVLPAGTSFIGVSELSVGLDAPTTATTLTRSGDFAADISFQAPGAASSDQSGNAGKNVKLGDGRDCTAGTLALTWSKKAGHGKHRVIKKATVSVDGAKVATVKKPKKNQVTTVSGLDPESAADVEVAFKIKGKGKFTADRSYLRCS